MKIIKLFIILLAIFFLSGCISLCEPDIELGSFDLLEESLPFFSYTSNQELRFLDQDSLVHILEVEHFNDSYNSRINVDHLCTEIVGYQETFYATITKTIRLTDILNGGIIHMSLNTRMTNKDNIDSTIVYDELNISGGTGIFCNNSSRIVTGIHEQYNNDTDAKVYFREAKIVGDTMINNVVYKDVYRSMNGSIYYNKLCGILVIYENEKDFLTLIR